MHPCLLFIYRFYLTTKIENVDINYRASNVIASILHATENKTRSDTSRKPWRAQVNYQNDQELFNVQRECDAKILADEH